MSFDIRSIVAFGTVNCVHYLSSLHSRRYDSFCPLEWQWSCKEHLKQMAESRISLWCVCLHLDTLQDSKGGCVPFATKELRSTMCSNMSIRCGIWAMACGSAMPAPISMPHKKQQNSCDCLSLGFFSCACWVFNCTFYCLFPSLLSYLMK